MTVKALVSNNAAKPLSYPYLGISESGRIVLFTKPRVGLCVRNNSESHRTAEYSEEWHESMFKPYDGKVILSND